MFGIKIPRISSICPISLSIEEKSNPVNKAVESLVWDKETRRELGEGLIEFTGHLVPVDYWKNFKSSPKKALEIIGGEGFEARKNPNSLQWEIAKRYTSVEEEKEEESKKESKPEKKEPNIFKEQLQSEENEFVEKVDLPEGTEL